MHVKLGVNLTVGCNFNPGDSFLFLIVSKQAFKSNSLEQDIALKLASGSSLILRRFYWPSRVVEQDKSFFLRNITKYDEASYCCKVFNLQGMYTSYVDVLVLGKWDNYF